MKYSYLLAIGFLFFLASCSNDDDTPEPIVYKYNTDIKTIIDNNCITNCHTNPPQIPTPISLANYTDLKFAVENHGLIDRISRLEGENGLMPLGGPRLSQEDIDKIINWRDNGFLEN